MKKMYQDTILDTVSKRRQSKELGSTLDRVIRKLPLKRRHLRTKLKDGENKANVGRIFPLWAKCWRVYLYWLTLYFCADSFELLTLESINLKTLDTCQKSFLQSSFSGLAALIQTKAILFSTNYSLSLNHQLITSIWSRIFQCSWRSQ